MADKEGQRPRPHRALDLAALVGAHPFDICGPVWRQGTRTEGPALRDHQADLLREVLALDADRVADDRVAVAPAAARALAHLRRDPRRDVVEARPAGLEQDQLALKLGRVHWLLLKGAGR